MWDARLRVLFILHRLKTKYINRTVWVFLGQTWPLLQRSKAEELRIYWRRFFPVTTRILRRICYSTYNKNTLDHGRKILTTIWLSPMYKIQIHVNTFVSELDHRGHKCNLNWIKLNKTKQWKWYCWSYTHAPSACTQLEPFICMAVLVA